VALVKAHYTTQLSTVQEVSGRKSYIAFTSYIPILIIANNYNSEVAKYCMDENTFTAAEKDKRPKFIDKKDDNGMTALHYCVAKTCPHDRSYLLAWQSIKYRAHWQWRRERKRTASPTRCFRSRQAYNLHKRRGKHISISAIFAGIDPSPADESPIILIASKISGWITVASRK
jgi:hypothetical protein